MVANQFDSEPNDESNPGQFRSEKEGINRRERRERKERKDFKARNMLNATPLDQSSGASPFLSTVLGDQTPGVLAGLGAGLLVLAMPTLVIRQTDTNTLTFSWNVLPGQYALFTGYALQQ